MSAIEQTRSPQSGGRVVTPRAAPPLEGAMAVEQTAAPIAREPQLRGQIVVVIGGSAGIGLETGRRARAEGAGWDKRAGSMASRV